MSLARVTRFRFFFFPHLFPKLTMPLRVATALLCPKLLMIYSSKKFFALRTLFIRFSFLLARSTGKQRLILDLRHVNAFIYKQSSSVKTCPWPLRFSTRTIIYLNLIWRQVTITLKFSKSAANTVSRLFICLLGILALGSSDFFSILRSSVWPSIYSFIFTNILKPLQPFSLAVSFLFS